MSMTNAQKAALKKRLLELLVAALTALITALSTGCVVKWSSNEVSVKPIGYWHYSATRERAPGEASPAPGTNAPAAPKK